MKHHALAILAALVFATSAHATDEKPYADTLTGDWGGMRTKLADAGVEVELGYSGDIWNVVDGGRKRITTYLDFIELRTTIDSEKLFGIKGNTISVALINSNGATTNGSTVGSTQGIDNSEVTANGVRVYEAWMQQNFLDDRISVLVGLHDLNTEFASTPISDNFIVPTMQIGQSFAQSGDNGPSVFPTTSLAGRLKVKPTSDSYVAVAAYDGVPGEPNRTSGTAVHFGDKDGLLLVGEVGWTPAAEGTEDELNKLAFGVWHYTTEKADLVNTTDMRDQQGFYGLSSVRFYNDVKNERSAGAFLRGGMNDGDTAQIDWDIETGIVANGFIPTRPNGQFGLGASFAHNGDTYITSVAGASDRTESIYELYYLDTVYDGVTVQPDVVYVVNPGTDQTTEDAFVVGMRLGVTF